MMARPAWRWLIAISLAWSIAPCARGQAVDGQLPDPITIARLTVYADMLNLSAQQRHALDDLHATYLEEFQKLREGEINKWIMSVRGAAYTRVYIARQRELLTRIAGIDDRLFDSVVPILADNQIERLARVQALRHRERQIMVRSFWWWGDAPPFDISQAVSELKLSPEQIQAIDAVLPAYEAALAAKMQRVIDIHFEGFSKTFEAYGQAGFTDERLVDPANIEAIMGIARPISNIYAPKRHALVADIVALNRRTLETLSTMLPGAAFRALRAAFIKATYPKAEMLARVTSPYEEVLARPELTEEQRGLLQAQTDQFEHDADAIINEIIARIERHRDTFVGAHDREEEFKDRNAVEQAADDAWHMLMTRRHADAERIAELVGKPAVVAAEEMPDPETADSSKVGFYGLFFARPEVSVSLPPAVSGSDIAQYAQWLGLDGPRQDELLSIHRRYLEQFASFKTKHREAIMKSAEALYKGDTVEGYTDENLRRYHAAEAAATSTQRALDDALFADLEQTLHLKPDDAGLQRIKLARQRQWFNCGVLDSRTAQAGGCFDGFIDLSSMLRRMRGLDLTQPVVDRVLAEYEQAMAPLLKSRHDAMNAFRAVDDDLRVEWQKRRAETGKPNPDMSDRAAASGIEKLRTAGAKAAEPISQLNRATVERVAEALPADAAERVRRTFERMAWLKIYSDSSNAAPLLTSALQLGDLASQQRSEVENIAAEYHAAYEALCEKMKSMVEGPGSAIYDQAHATQQELRALWQRCNARQRMLFERHELNMRVWQSLRGVLSEVQAGKIGLNGTRPEGPGENEDFGI